MHPVKQCYMNIRTLTYVVYTVIDINSLPVCPVGKKGSTVQVTYICMCKLETKCLFLNAACVCMYGMCSM